MSRHKHLSKTGAEASFFVCDLGLAWPCWSKVLLVSFILRKDRGCFIQCLPGAGESGWVYVRHGGWGSAVPATSHCSFFHYRETEGGGIQALLLSVRAQDM